MAGIIKLLYANLRMVHNNFNKTVNVLPNQRLKLTE